MTFHAFAIDDRATDDGVEDAGDPLRWDAAWVEAYLTAIRADQWAEHHG